MAREYPLVTHWPTEVVTPKYAARLGSAVVMAVDRVEEAMPETTRLIKMSVRCLSVRESCLLCSMGVHHPMPDFLVEIFHHLLQDPLGLPHLLRRDAVGQNV